MTCLMIEAATAIAIVMIPTKTLHVRAHSLVRRQASTILAWAGIQMRQTLCDEVVIVRIEGLTKVNASLTRE